MEIPITRHLSTVIKNPVKASIKIGVVTKNPILVHWIPSKLTSWKILFIINIKLEEPTFTMEYIPIIVSHKAILLIKPNWVSFRNDLEFNTVPIMKTLSNIVRIPVTHWMLDTFPSSLAKGDADNCNDNSKQTA